MGDRAIVVFHDTKKERISPCIYLHWQAENVPKLIEECHKLMADRLGDVDYSAARFVGICHAKNPTSNLSLGIFNAPDDILDKPGEHSPGDGGTVLVDASTFEWKAYGGYLEEKRRES